MVYMKHIITHALSIICMLLSVVTHAQSPQGIPYQAAARNSSGAIMASTNISVRFTIRDSIATGAIKYQESHSVTTSAQGIFSLIVGQGTVMTGTFAGINWGPNDKFLQVELDNEGGSTYVDMATQQLMSVPYALNTASVKFNVSRMGDTVYSGDGSFVLIPGGSAANNNPPYPSIILGAGTVCAGSSTTLTDSVSGGIWSSSNTSIATIGSTGIVSGVSEGTTTISYTVTNNYGTAYATKVFTVNPLPNAGTITGTATVCAVSTTALSNATTGGVWSSSATGVATVGSTGVVSAVAAGTATISYTVTNGCGSALATRVVTVNPLPSAGTITGTATVCAVSTTALSNATTGGVWSSSATGVATVGSTGVVSAVAAGTATISYTVTNGCGSALATRVVTVNPLPSAGTITGTATVTAGSTTTLSNATTGGAWSSSATGIATVGSTGVVSGVTAGTATISYTVNNSCGSAVATQLVTILTIGSTYGGGVIAYILLSGDPGYIAGETHGLIAAPSDQSTGIEWGCYATTVGGTSIALGTGATNTAIVSAACGTGTAARLCADLVLNGYSDWYLPSREELIKLYINRISIGGFSTGYYWSSSEYSAYMAWLNAFYVGSSTSGGKYSPNYVRAVRAF